MPTKVLASGTITFGNEEGVNAPGLMLGGECSKCCGECSCDPGTDPPDTVTLTFSGLANTIRGPDLIGLNFSAQWGSGAAGVVKEQGGEPGPITAVELTSGGSGYAVLGRQEPTLVVSGGVDNGTGLVCSWTFSTNNPTGLVTWTATAGTVTAGGNGYIDGESLAIDAEDPSVTVQQGAVTVRTARSEPTANMEVSGTGTGATLTPNYTQSEGEDGRPVWSVTSVTIHDGGSGYTAGDPVFLNLTDGTVVGNGFFDGAASVDQDGAVIGVTITDGGTFYRDTGVVESLTVTDGGEFYREDPDLPPIVAAVTVTLSQPLYATGSGASLSATVDQTVASETFGQITAVTIDDGGSGYLAWDWITGPCCETWYEGREFVLRRVDVAGSCCYEYATCGFTVNASLAPVSASVGRDFFRCPWSAEGYPETCGSYVSTTDPAGDCDDISFELSNERGVTATLTAGGEYIEGEWPINPQSVTFSFGGATQGGERIDPGTLVNFWPTDYTRNEYPTNVPEGSLCSASVYSNEGVGNSTYVEVHAGFCGSGTHDFPEINPTDDEFSAVVIYTCPCRYAAVVAVTELLSTGVWDDPNTDPNTRDPLRRRYAAWRQSVWDGGVVESSTGWPSSSDFEWSLVSCFITFRSSAAADPYEDWTPTGGTSLDPWPVFDALNLPPSGSFQAGQFAGLSERSNLPGGFASPPPPDGLVSWTITQ